VSQRSTGRRHDLEENEIRWWTFAGGRINTTLSYGLATQLNGVQIIADNFLLRLRGDDLTLPRFQDGLAALRSPAVRDDEALWNGIFNSLPGYRLSKFQPLIPPWVATEVVARYLLDVPGTKRWLGEGQTSI
jgi:ATP-dependent helicase Lhr and Lhr-like helicase